jgi:peptidoglycan/LPS O-acetylase OafA/YrhL
MKYRAEIDGLRAIAVLPVMFFHAGFEFFSGGFVGVDIFFVISGYLIATLIISELEIGKFNLTQFYERRARRILPALFFVMLACLPFAFSWLSPSELKDFGQSLVAVSTFSSNILFWLESGYFEGTAELKPLLHTWSLAVEEQFYIFFPLFMILLWKVGQRWLLVFLMIIFLISLSGAQWGAYSLPSLTFYSLFSRGWELILGIFIAFYFKNFHFLKSQALNQILSILGLVMIVYSIISFDERTPFPSLYALVPTLGTSLIILSATSNTIVYKLLSWKPLIGIGLISYSSYLWHQPIIAFAQIYLIDIPSKFFMLLLLGISMMLAYFSWRFIEKPFRDPGKINKKSIFNYSLSACIFFILFGGFLHINDGFKNRFTQYQLSILSYENSRERDELFRNRVCFLRKDQSAIDFQSECFDGHTLIWGDSHAAAISHGMLQYRNLTQLTSSACPPIIGFDVPIRNNCMLNNNFIFDILQKNQPKFLILHANWISNNYDSYLNEFEASLDMILSSQKDIAVLVVGGLPHWKPSLPRRMIKSMDSFDKNISYLPNDSIKKIEAQDRKILGLIKKINSKNLKFLSLTDHLCIDHKCLIRASSNNMEPMVSDASHLTGSGSLEIAKIIESELQSFWTP